MCVGVVKTPRRSIRIRCNARIRDDNPTGHGGHGGGSCPIRLLESGLAEEDAVGVDLAGLPHLAPEVSRTDGCDVFHEFADGIVGLT